MNLSEFILQKNQRRARQALRRGQVARSFDGSICSLQLELTAKTARSTPKTIFVFFI